MEEEPFGEFFSKSPTMPKKLEGTLKSRSVLYVTPKERKNFFGSVR